MLGLIECLLAVAATALTCMFAGRVAAVTLTAVTAATAAIVMPPSMSWQVDQPTDAIALLFQSVMGLVVAYGLPREWRARHSPVVLNETPMRPPERICSLATVFRGLLERNSNLAGKLGDVETGGELDDRLGVSPRELEEILEDVLRMALSDSKVTRVSAYAGKQPSLDQITIASEYDSDQALPRLRLLGRTDRQRAFRPLNWPSNCSCGYFDNGHEHIYLISIGRLATSSAVERRARSDGGFPSNL
jgi:hypothetical protein